MPFRFCHDDLKIDTASVGLRVHEGGTSYIVEPHRQPEWYEILSERWAKPIKCFPFFVREENSVIHRDV